MEQTHIHPIGLISFLHFPVILAVSPFKCELIPMCGHMQSCMYAWTSQFCSEVLPCKVAASLPCTLDQSSCPCQLHCGLKPTPPRPKWVNVLVRAGIWNVLRDKSVKARRRALGPVRRVMHVWFKIIPHCLMWWWETDPKGVWSFSGFQLRVTNV